MKFLRYTLSILLMFLWISLSYAQINEQAARQELQKRGISEARFREEMAKRGVDVNKIDPNNTSEIARIEGIAREVIAQLEKEVKAGGSSTGAAPVAANPTPSAQEVLQAKEKELATKLDEKETNAEASKATKEIKKAVEKGATLEEAISETVSEKTTNNLPPALIYGQNLFRDNSLKLFRTSEDAKPTGSYVLGVGDVVAISIFGTSRFNSANEISKDGYIQPTGEFPVGRYYISGLSIDEASTLLKQGISRFVRFNPGEFKLSIATARTINVNIFGEVINNGSFNISALNTAFNALVAAGGPSDKGSVRRIKHIRAGQKPRNIDIYEFINNPSIAYDLYLQENDILNVPLAEKVVTISGAVSRPYRYELLDNENLIDLVRFAGGLTPEALTQSIQIERTEKGERKYLNIDYDAVKSGAVTFPLLNGDIITINGAKKLPDNKVFIEGGILEPVDFAFRPGMKISDVLSRVTIQEDAILENAYLLRYNDDQTTVRYLIVNLQEVKTNPSSAENILLQRGDKITIRSKRDFAEAKTASITGAVRIPGEFPLGDKSLKISDLVFLAGGLQEKAAAFAYILRNQTGSVKTQEYIYVDLNEALSNPSSTQNRAIQPNDQLIIYSSESFVDKAEVRITGAVRKPTQTLFHPTLTLKEMILLSEGLQDIASPSNVDIFRVNFESDKKTTYSVQKVNLTDDTDLSKAAGIKLMPNDLIVVRNAPEFKSMRTVTIQGETVYPGTYALLNDNTKVTDILQAAGGITKEAYPEGTTLLRADQNTGFIIFDLYAALKNKNSNENIILQPGDIIEIPRRNNIVSLMGATNYDELYSTKLISDGKLNFAYHPGKSAKFYVDHYGGGFDEKADRRRLTVEHPNGKIDKSKSFLFFTTYPKVMEGSVIKVPLKKEKPQPLPGEKKESEDVDWGQVLKDSITQATAILSLILLLRAIN